MKIKTRRDESPEFFKRFLRGLYRFFSNRKTKIVRKTLVSLIVLIIGIGVGMLITGFFGTLDNPSQTVLDFLHSRGIGSLRASGLLIEGILAENVKIPINYIRGQLSNPEKIYIDISFINYQKLNFKREQALERGVLVSASDDYVPATITHDGKSYNAQLRLKGDWVDHFETDKWSFRIKIRGNDALFGMKVFSIQHPKTRVYLNELIYHLALKNEDIMGLRYKFIEVIVNGENRGIYALEEHFTDELIADNNRNEGIILKFDEDPAWDEYYQRSNLTFREGELFQSKVIETFENKKILADPIKATQFEKARSLLEFFKTGKLKTHEVFDIDKLAKYYAITSLLSCQHGSESFNIRFYYSPITSRLEPIGFDADCLPPNAENVIAGYLPNCLYSYNNSNDCEADPQSFWNLIFSDEIFFRRYMEELVRVSEKSYLDDFFEENEDEIKRNLNILHKDYPYIHFADEAIYKSQNQIREMLNPVQGVNAYFKEVSDNKIILDVGSVNRFPLEIISINYNETVFSLVKGEKTLEPMKISGIKYEELEFQIPASFEWNNSFIFDMQVKYKIFGTPNVKNESILPWDYVDGDFVEKDFIRKKANIEDWEFLEVNKESKIITIKKGVWVLNDSLIIPSGFTVFCNEGTTLDLIKGSTILSYSNLRFLGDIGDPIKITSSDKTGQGVSVLSSNKESLFKNVIFEDLKGPLKNDWELTGGISFYESDVRLNNVIFSNIQAEDMLNIVRSDLEIINTKFENANSDCLDIDFGKGKIKDSSFTNCKGDGLDFSGSYVNISNVNLKNIGDKGISIGEKSEITLNKIDIDRAFIGLASKDLSTSEISDIKIKNCEYGIAVYEKKSEFGAASINVINAVILDCENNYIIEKESNFLIDGKIILGGEKGVYAQLYPQI